MNGFSLLQYALFLGLVLVLVRPVGCYLERVFAGERTILDPALRPLERAIYRGPDIARRAGRIATSVTRAVLKEAPGPVLAGA